MVLPYVYKLTHKTTNHFYIGYRAANRVMSSQDLGIVYFTSSTVVQPIFAEFDILIVAEFFDGRSAWTFEQQLILEHWGDPLLLNRSVYKNSKCMFTTADRPSPKSNQCVYHNPTTGEYKFFRAGTVPVGWVRGRGVKNRPYKTAIA